MILNDLNISNVFKFFKNVSRPGIIAFRVAGETILDQITIIPLDEYLLMHPEKEVYPICSISDYNASKQPTTSPVKLKDVVNGTIAWTGSEFGLPQRILVTSNVNRSAIVVAFLGIPEMIDRTLQISDLGFAGDFNGYRDDNRLRFCPNCSQRVLSKDGSENTVGFNITCICQHCGCKVAISWSMMR